MYIGMRFPFHRAEKWVLPCRKLEVLFLEETGTGNGAESLALAWPAPPGGGFRVGFVHVGKL